MSATRATLEQQPGSACPAVGAVPGAPVTEPGLEPRSTEEEYARVAIKQVEEASAIIGPAGETVYAREDRPARENCVAGGPRRRHGGQVGSP